MINVWIFDYHTVTVWAYSKLIVEKYKEDLIKNWSYAHSPSIACGRVRQVELELIDETDIYIGAM